MHSLQVLAAREAIGDVDFFLIARTDARGTSAKTGLQDAITRTNLYQDAGADASFVEAPRRWEIAEKTKVKLCAQQGFAYWFCSQRLRPLSPARRA